MWVRAWRSPHGSPVTPGGQAHHLPRSAYPPPSNYQPAHTTHRPTSQTARFQAFLMRRADPATRRPRPPMPSSRSPTARCSRRRRRRRRIHTVSNSAALSVSPTPSIITGSFARAILKSSKCHPFSHHVLSQASPPRRRHLASPCRPRHAAAAVAARGFIAAEHGARRGAAHAARRAEAEPEAKGAGSDSCSGSASCRVRRIVDRPARVYLLPLVCLALLSTRPPYYSQLKRLPTLYSNRSNSTQLIRRRTRLTLAPLEALCWT